MIQCRNHRTRPAMQLCVVCGNWYCDDCFGDRKDGACVSCSSASGTTIPSILNHWFASPLRWAGWVLALAFATAVVLVHPLFAAPATILAIGQLSLLTFLRGSQARTGRTTRRAISDAQVQTLLKVTDNKLSAKRLAESTGTSVRIAETKLRELVSNNKLESMVEGYEVVYGAPPTLPDFE